MGIWEMTIMGWTIIEWVMILGVITVALAIGMFGGKKLFSGWLGRWIMGKPLEPESEDDEMPASQDGEEPELLDLDALSADDRIKGALLNAFRRGDLPKSGIMSAREIHDKADIADWATVEAVEDLMHPAWLIPATADISDSLYGLAFLYGYLHAHFGETETSG